MPAIEFVECPKCKKVVAAHYPSCGEVYCPECRQTWAPCPECGDRMFTNGVCPTCGPTPTPFDEMLGMLYQIMETDKEWREHIAITQEPNAPETISSQAQHDEYWARWQAWHDAKDGNQREWYRLQKAHLNAEHALREHVIEHFPHYQNGRHLHVPDPLMGGYWDVCMAHDMSWQWVGPAQPQVPSPAGDQSAWEVVRDHMFAHDMKCETLQDIYNYATAVAANYLRIWQAAEDQSDIGLAHLAAAIKRETQDG